MFIHLGGSRMISVREVIAILDAEAAGQGAGSGLFLDGAVQSGRIETVVPGEVKSYVITRDRIYASPVSSATLKKRAEAAGKPWKQVRDS
ncbi:extracellular matrix regulator RemB [Staphylospora marina]|uniref:extracellular matrix regulator RemB n=1 Tax=Staphylospora marina TaxID=2490858 RepID=UPI0019D0914D|nr:extracellular matrix/biofilm biosynthesis regulator RemA family protein [Staphylospora marina]